MAVNPQSKQQRVCQLKGIWRLEHFEEEPLMIKPQHKEERRRRRTTRRRWKKKHSMDL